MALIRQCEKFYPFFVLCATLCFLAYAFAAETAPEPAFKKDRAALDEIQRDAFKYMWEESCPHSGMPYEATFDWEERPVAVGGTGFGIAAIVVATDREWITREQAVARILKIVLFLRDKTPRKDMHGAFPHWLEGSTGKIRRFGSRDDGADIVETSLLMQGLLIARAYFNGPGVEEKLRTIITELWRDVDWDWFSNGEENGLYWHWSIEHGFHHGLKILGYNECLITYVLALASPTHPITKKTYDYWNSGVDYLPRTVYGYHIEATSNGGGPLFLAQYSFIGLDPRNMADGFVQNGYFVRNVKQTLSNRGYCIQDAAPDHRYSENLWGLTASQTKAGYTASEPSRDMGTIAPTAAISSMPYTPHYSLQVLGTIHGKLRDTLWGKYGPKDAISPGENWVSDMYLAIDQLPMVCMIENYRSGLLWRLLMSDPDVRAGLEKACIAPPGHQTGFPEAVVTLVKIDGHYREDAYEIRRHPDSGLYHIPYWLSENAVAEFTMREGENEIIFSTEENGLQGRNILAFGQTEVVRGKLLTLTMRVGEETHALPIRLH